VGAVYCVLCDDTHPLVGNGGVRGLFGMKLSLDKKYRVLPKGGQLSKCSQNSIIGRVPQGRSLISKLGSQRPIKSPTRVKRGREVKG
jgi:hypothetical protein